uniref:Uncharacterized protein n=1 Tax=Cacopsylla melanoneura TaxID=428564 RepID=A0A8D9BPR0_9HEMI
MNCTTGRLILLFLIGFVFCNDEEPDYMGINLDLHTEYYDCRPYPQVVQFEPHPDGKTYSVSAVRVDRCGATYRKYPKSCEPTKQELVRYKLVALQGGPVTTSLYKHTQCAWGCKKKDCDSYHTFNEEKCQCERL